MLDTQTILIAGYCAVALLVAVMVHVSYMKLADTDRTKKILMATSIVLGALWPATYVAVIGLILIKLSDGSLK